MLSLYEDRDGGNCHASGGGMPITHPVSEGSSKEFSVAKQRDILTGVPHSTCTDEGVVDHKGSGKVFIERISDAHDTIEPSSDCLVNEEKEDNRADTEYLESSSEDDEDCKRIASFHRSHPVVSFNRSQSFPSDSGRISRTPSDTSLPNG